LTEVIDTSSAKMTFTAAGGISGIPSHAGKNISIIQTKYNR